MKIYTNYEFYSNTYKGDMSENDFNKVVARASYEICKNIFDRDYAGYEDEVQMATCSIADILLKIEQLEDKKNTSISNGTLKSQSVGDYSKTYENSSITDIDVEISNQKQKIKEELKRYLLTTGLLYRGV